MIILLLLSPWILLLVAYFAFPRRRLTVVIIAALLAGTVMAAPFIHPYSEKRLDNFVLSEDTPISIGHGIGAISPYTESKEPIDILSYGVHFRIPRNYIKNILYNKRDKVVDFTLLSLYPDFAGVTGIVDDTLKLTEHNKPWWWGLSPNLVRIATIGGDIGKEGYNKGVFKAEENEPDHPWQYGLLRSTKSSYSVLQDVYFQRPSNNNPSFVVFCSKESDVVQECLVYTRVSDNLLLRCQYHRELLPHWQEINEKVTSLVQSFIVKEGK